MKKTTLTLIALTLFAPINLLAQKIAHSFKWEAITIDGGAYIGIANSRKKALVQIEKLVELKKGHERVVDYEIRYSPIEQNPKKNIYDEFYDLIPNNKTYVHISKAGLEALQIEREWGRYNSLEYYKDALKIKKNKIAEKELVNNVLAFEKFLFLTKNKKSKSIYMAHTSSK